jgi:hypothetical protein
LKRGIAIKKDRSQTQQIQKLEKTLTLPKDAMMEMQSRKAELTNRLKPIPEPLKFMHGPTQVVNTVNAINAVTSNLASILGKNEVRFVLSQALKKAADSYPHLASLKVHPEAATLDVRFANPEFSSSEKTVKSLETLMRIFLDIASKSQKLID